MTAQRKWIWIAAIASTAILGSGCAGWKSKTKATLAAAHEAAKGMSKGVEAYYGQKCKDVAVSLRGKCSPDDRGSDACKPLVECDAEFKKFILVVKSIHFAVATGLAAIAIDHKQEALQVAIQVIARVKALYDLANKAGITKWKQ